MSFKFNCPKCRRRLDVDDGMRGKRLECPVCGVFFTIPVLRKPRGGGSAVFWIVFLLAIFAGGYFLLTKSGKRSQENVKTADYDAEVSPDESRRTGVMAASEEARAAQKDELPQAPVRGDSSGSEDVNEIKLGVQDEKVGAGDALLDSGKEAVEISQKSVSEAARQYLWIEAEDAGLIEPSFEVDYDEECSGGKFLSHPEDSGSSWAKNKEDGRDVPCGVGRADYSIEIPSDGEWFFWGRVKWETGCSDCFGVFVDDAKPLRRRDVFIAHGFDLEMLGKDNTLDTWHWISSQVFDLKAGRHVLSLRNHDDGSHIDRILLTNDAFFRPQGLGDCHLRRGADFSERIHKGENFYLAWFIDMNVKSGKWLAKKDRLFPDEKDPEMRALILDGEDWWKDYQFMFLLDPPASGRAGAVFYYKDEKNFYELAFEGGNVDLSKIVDGERTSFGRKSLFVENPERKLRKANDKRQLRATINRFKEQIQVYIDGAKFFDVKDESLHAGRAGFFSERAKGFAIDDFEIASLGGSSKAVTNERIEWFCNRKVRVFNSVLDSFGATGGFHPGDYRDKRDEAHLAALQKSIGGRDVGKEAKLLDWLWLTFDSGVFREKHGLSKGAGYIVAQSLDEEKEAFLWMPVVLHGDWDFEFKAAGEAKEFNLHLIDAGGNPDKSWRKAIPVAEALKSGEGAVAEQWTRLRLSKRSGSAVLSRNGVKISDSGEIPDRELRLALSMKAGTVFVDTVSASLRPSLFHDFKYNTPWGLALSDWSLHCVDRIKHGGGYYNYLILSPEKKSRSKHAKITTKRLFSGDFAAMVELDLEDSSDGEPFRALSLGFADEKGAEEKILLSREAAVRFDKVKKGNIAKLNNFSTERRRMTQLFLSVRNGNAVLYLNDEEGSMRPLDCGRFANPAGAFRFFIGGEPELRISRILIWGQEL